MALDNEQTRRYNPVEVSTVDGGNYLQRFPLELDEALSYAIPDSYEQRFLLMKLVQYGTNATYMSEKLEVQPVKMSTIELGKRTNIKQPNIIRALRSLEKAGWIETLQGGKGKASAYLVNFEKVTTTLCKYHSEIQPSKEPKSMKRRRPDWTSRRRRNA